MKNLNNYEDVKVPGGRYWEPGCEENTELPMEQWIPDDIELPFV